MIFARRSVAGPSTSPTPPSDGPEPARDSEKARAVLASGPYAALFDRTWYLACHKDVKAAGIDPLRHFASHGEREGRDPHPLFNVFYYRLQLPADQADANTLVHFATSPLSAAFDPHPLFDLKYYAGQVEPMPSAGHYLAHYLSDGWRAGIDPHPDFDSTWYAAAGTGTDLPSVAPLMNYVLAVGPSTRPVSLKHRLRQLADRS